MMQIESHLLANIIAVVEETPAPQESVEHAKADRCRFDEVQNIDVTTGYFPIIYQ